MIFLHYTTVTGEILGFYDDEDEIPFPVISITEYEWQQILAVPAGGYLIQDEQIITNPKAPFALDEDGIAEIPDTPTQPD